MGKQWCSLSGAEPPSSPHLPQHVPADHMLQLHSLARRYSAHHLARQAPAQPSRKAAAMVQLLILPRTTLCCALSILLQIWRRCCSPPHCMLPTSSTLPHCCSCCCACTSVSPMPWQALLALLLCCSLGSSPLAQELQC